jgi:hypothetical protein
VDKEISSSRDMAASVLSSRAGLRLLLQIKSLDDLTDYCERCRPSYAEIDMILNSSGGGKGSYDINRVFSFGIWAQHIIESQCRDGRSSSYSEEDRSLAQYIADKFEDHESIWEGRAYAIRRWHSIEVARVKGRNLKENTTRKFVLDHQAKLAPKDYGMSDNLKMAI